MARTLVLIVVGVIVPLIVLGHIFAVTMCRFRDRWIRPQGYCQCHRDRRDRAIQHHRDDSWLLDAPTIPIEVDE